MLFNRINTYQWEIGMHAIIAVNYVSTFVHIANRESNITSVTKSANNITPFLFQYNVRRCTFHIEMGLASS